MWNGLPFRPHESDAPLTAPTEFALATIARASERHAFDQHMEEKWRAIEVCEFVCVCVCLCTPVWKAFKGINLFHNNTIVSAFYPYQEEKAAAEEAARKAEEEEVRQYRRTLRFKVCANMKRAEPLCRACPCKEEVSQLMDLGCVVCRQATPDVDHCRCCRAVIKGLL